MSADTQSTKKEFFGHPRGLATLFGTELWERLSYYGMRAILVLYMVATLENGGLGFTNKQAAAIYGAYTSLVYLLSLPGGWAADNFIGARAAVMIGGAVIALGEFALAGPTMGAFYTGLVLIVLGTGLLKPNISAMVGALYAPTDVRRDAGFSIFYMGINMGAFLAPFVCGFLAQSETFKGMLKSAGMNPAHSWHFAFAAAGAGMALGLGQYYWGRENLAAVGRPPENPKGSPITGILAYLGIGGALFAFFAGMTYVINQAGNVAKGAFGAVVGLIVIGLVWSILKPLSGEERKRMISVVIFVASAALFWAIFEQAGSSLTLFTDKMTDSSLLGIAFPSSFFQAINPVFIILLAPVFSILWVKWGEKQPSSPMKFTIGLLFAGIGFIVAAFAAGSGVGGAKASGHWLLLIYFIHTIGELCLSPVGLSTMTKLAPAQLVGLVMGIWFLGPTLGNYVGGILAGHFDETHPETVVGLFYQLGFAGIIGAVVMFALIPIMRKLMGGVK
ncbi:MAG: peptide MFS transporter [Blastocatellia bacterium]|nr:peptide MFS transporter [Blastocatellia bacterium]